MGPEDPLSSSFGTDASSQGSQNLSGASFPVDFRSEADLDDSRIFETLLAPGIRLILEPGAVSDWDHFKAGTDTFSVALDGRVSGPSIVDLSEMKANFDHHAGVDRISTPCTARQVLNAIKNEHFFDAFSSNGNPAVTIYANDCDADICFAIWALTNAELVCSPDHQQAIDNLFALVDLFDRLGGVARIDPQNPLVRQLAWINEPYEIARMDPNYSFGDLNGADMARIIEAVCGRITRVIEGRGCEHDLDTRFDLLHHGKDWVLIKEHGYYARSGLEDLNVELFVSVRPPREDGHFMYSAGKIGHWTGISLEQLYNILNAAEKDPVTADNCWGGSDLIGGSPRATGSTLSPEDLTLVIDEWRKYTGQNGDSEASAKTFISTVLPAVKAGFEDPPEIIH